MEIVKINKIFSIIIKKLGKLMRNWGILVYFGAFCGGILALMAGFVAGRTGFIDGVFIGSFGTFF